MTLVVGRVCESQVAIAADTLLVEHKTPLPPDRGVVKSCILPGDVCVSFSNSPELANGAFRSFCTEFPTGATYAETVTFFEESSSATGNEYLVAFSAPAKVVKISEGQRRPSLTDVAWIGDRQAYSRYREYHQRKRERPHAGRAIHAAYFAGELADSPASGVFSALREVAADHEIENVGGFVSVVSSRKDGFRHSAYSNMLFDWPCGQPTKYDFRYAPK